MSAQGSSGCCGSCATCVREREAGVKSILAVMLMATEHALTMPKASDWSREKWLTRLPEFSEFVMVHETLGAPP